MALPPQTRLTDEERANLVAFLDGEVDDSLAHQLEEKVARSVSVRREIEALEKTWELLDWLPRPHVPDDFAGQTLTRIHSQELRSEQMQERIWRAAAGCGKGFAWVACVAVAATIAFFCVRYAWPDSNRDLVEHLDVVENLATYRAIPDVKFLDNLNRLGIFVEPEPVGDVAPQAAPDAPAANTPGAEPGDTAARQ